MPSVDLPIALLVLGVMALAASRTFPAFPVLPALRRRRRTSGHPMPRLVVEPSYRRVITGRPATLAPPDSGHDRTPRPRGGTRSDQGPARRRARHGGAVDEPGAPVATPDAALAGATGPMAGSADVLDRHREPPDVVAARALIDHYLDRDPRQVADLLQRWIDNDPPSSRHK